MSEYYKIEDACAAIQRASFPIGNVPSSDSAFEEICHLMIEDSVRFQEEAYPERRVEIWSSPLIQTVHAYAKKHGFAVVVAAPADPATMLPLSTRGGQDYTGFEGSCAHVSSGSLVWVGSRGGTYSRPSTCRCCPSGLKNFF